MSHRRVRLAVDYRAVGALWRNTFPDAATDDIGAVLRTLLTIIERCVHVVIHCELCDGRGETCAACAGRGWLESP